jgi:hypothetical protein
MRDTDLIRLRVQSALAGVSLVLAAGCGEPPSAPAPKKPLKVSKSAEDGPSKDEKADEKAPADPKKDPEPAGANGADPLGAGAALAANATNTDDAFDYFGPPRDPFADHDEEEGCPKGDWCGAPEDARLFSVKGVEDTLDCPSRIVANPQAEIKNKKSKKWKGLSFDPRMQGRLVTTTTEDARKSGKDKSTCCYHWFEYCSGRPLLDDDEQKVAELRRGDGWSSPPETVGGPAPQLDDSIRERLAREWLDDALMEHASISSFARTTLELMALGAPPDLLAQVQQASLDEVRHAGRCFALARRYSGESVEPGPLEALPPRESTFERLARDTFLEGCVGETVAALVATRQARGCTDAEIRSTLEMMAEDESRHAALAWQTIEWAIAQDRPKVVGALRAIAAELRPRDGADRPVDDSLVSHGRLGPAAQAQARMDAWREIIDPTLDKLLESSLSAQA